MLWYPLCASMSSKSIPSELTYATLSSRLFSLGHKRRFKNGLWALAAAFLLFACVYIEIQTSIIQSGIFTHINKRVSFVLGQGPSPRIAFPGSAPFDDRRGYSKLPAFQSRLESADYRITHQVQQSETLVSLIGSGISPPYPQPADAGLAVTGSDGTSLFRYGQSEFLFGKMKDVPPLLVKTLLFLENRDLDSPATPWQNPAIEWNRLFRAVLLYVGAKLYLPVSIQGGSTLAVQLEKFRHSPHGRTDSAIEKLRQVMGASLKAYRLGANTRAWRERIIIDYLNSVPLAAAPNYGEIHGIGEGLYAWFGMPLAEVVQALNTPGANPSKVRAFKHVLALLISVRAPSVFLVDERASLNEKVNQFTRLMARAGIIDWELAAELQERSIEFLPAAPLPPQPSSGRNKAANAVRITMMDLLGVTNLYDFNRLHLEVASTIDVPLQNHVTEFLHSLADPEVVRAKGLDSDRLLRNSDPRKVVYSFLLVEPTTGGNLVRVQADNLSTPFDFNRSVKLELGSTAKVRTLTHYLEIMAELHKELSGHEEAGLKEKNLAARDALTQWAIETLRQDRAISLESFLERAMERRYSASPQEAFFTGGGVHHFENFEPQDNGRILSVNEAFRHSVNLVFIRLMGDLVAYHRARLPYGADEVLSNPNHPERRRMLGEIAEEESRSVLRRAYQTYRGQTQEDTINRLLGPRGRTPRRLTVLFFAWRIGADEPALASWLAKHHEASASGTVADLFRAYSNRRLTLADFGYLLSLHPLHVWCAGELLKDPGLSWEELYKRSAEARSASSAWLLNPRNRRAQDLRLRIKIERDAFARMTPYWQRLGFPFKTMVPSYATAIGSSSDRPVALAELVGILVNDGVRRRSASLTKIHFARATPYETVFQRTAGAGERVLPPEVARMVRKAMAEVVASGTARRVGGVFKLADGTPITVGGKTGSGDNRFQTFNRRGAVISSRATNRTATFVFYIGDRYFGVITTYVQGREAENYQFTSALPVTILKLLAPAIVEKLDQQRGQT